MVLPNMASNDSDESSYHDNIVYQIRFDKWLESKNKATTLVTLEKLYLQKQLQNVEIEKTHIREKYRTWKWGHDFERKTKLSERKKNNTVW